MFRTVSRLFFPNPFDRMLKKLAKKKGKKVLLSWNRGLGDIPLGLYAMIHRIKEFVPDAEITFLTRKNLKEGFSLLKGIHCLFAEDWKRGEKVFPKKTLLQLGYDPKTFDLIIENPSPTDWVRWQRGTLTPKLTWDSSYEEEWKKFGLEDGYTYIGVQLSAETNYGFWRNWPLSRWTEFLDQIQKFKHVKVILFGFGDEPKFSHPHIIDLRGKTNLFELLSIIKNKCRAVILPDSGVLSMVYYLNALFLLHVVSLWGDPNHGILKQNVSSPNPLLKHSPMVGDLRNLETIKAEDVIDTLFPLKPLEECTHADDVIALPVQNVGVVIMAGGEGSRVNANGPKGLFPILGKTLFEWVCEKVPDGVPIAIMTSPMNHEKTVQFFEEKKFFGKKIFFFQQPVLPLLDKDYNPLPIVGPDGNGSFFKAFAELLPLFEKEKIEIVSVVPIENPMADPMDMKLMTHLKDKGADIALKCIEDAEASESMGALVVREEGGVEIVEYIDQDPQTKYFYRYAGMCAFTLEFLKKAKDIELPVHLAWKTRDEISFWKRERFIFDVFPYANQIAPLCYPRIQIYSPLKNLQNISEIEKILAPSI